jgi:hypothetical protein
VIKIMLGLEVNGYKQKYEMVCLEIVLNMQNRLRRGIEEICARPVIAKG